MPALRNSIAILTTCWTLGCYTTKRVTLKANPDASARPASIEVVTTRGQRLVVYQPEVRGDSLYGWLDEGSRNPAAYAVSDIGSASTRQLSGGRTAIAVATIVVGFLLGVMLWTVSIIEEDL